VFLKLWSAAVRQVVGGVPQAALKRKSITKIVSNIEGMKNTPIHVCAKTTFVG
jgi:hypothetical protein